MSAADFTASDANDSQVNIFQVDGNYANGRIEISDSSAAAPDGVEHVLDVYTRNESRTSLLSAMRVECRRISGSMGTTSLDVGRA
jgi:hypothetical protein